MPIANDHLRRLLAIWPPGTLLVVDALSDTGLYDSEDAVIPGVSLEKGELALVVGNCVAPGQSFVVTRGLFGYVVNRWFNVVELCGAA